MPCTSFDFKSLECGPRWSVVKSGLPRLSAAMAYARDWFTEHGYDVLAFDRDRDNTACDIMVSRNGALYQYAIESTRA